MQYTDLQKVYCIEYIVRSMQHTFGFGHYSSPPHLLPLSDSLKGFSACRWGCVSAQSTGRAILQPTRSFGGSFFQPTRGWALSQPIEIFEYKYFFNPGALCQPWIAGHCFSPGSLGTFSTLGRYASPGSLGIVSALDRLALFQPWGIVAALNSPTGMPSPF
jgi:hypothetical protein